MKRLKPASVTTAREYFSHELRRALRRNKILTQSSTFQYLVDLLTQYIETERFFEKTQDGKLSNHYLVDLYARHLAAGPEEKKAILRRLGDISLVISGYFAASLSRKNVSIEYYFGMGGTAYLTLSRMHFDSTSQNLFVELSSKFQPLSNILGELSERSGVQSNSDLLRLYERWLTTGSESLRNRLSRHGLTSVIAINHKTSH